MAPVIIGYYRYTDIWFEWHQALPNKEDGSPLKAALAHDALVHPDHPLRNGKDAGIEMHMGTLQNYESRLLFSSAQVEYIREWLYATKLTKERIPLPYSNCLLVESDLRNVSPIFFNDGGELRNSLKKIDKNNKRLKGANDPRLKSRRQTFELARTFWIDKVGTWMACDFEAWDRDHTMITEFGWSTVQWQDGKEVQEQGHLVVDERKYYRSTYVPNNKEHYNFGETEYIPKKDFKKRIQNLIVDASKNGPLYLIFHDHSQDVKYFKSREVEVPLTGLTYMLPDARPDDGLWVIDTAELFCALEGESGNDKRSLERVCRLLQIPVEWLHNAGNDAHYTMLAAKAMMSGDPLDMQREQRWPSNRAGELDPQRPTVKAQFLPHEEDSDYSDTEGMVPYNATPEERRALGIPEED